MRPLFSWLKLLHQNSTSMQIRQGQNHQMVFFAESTYGLSGALKLCTVIIVDQKDAPRNQFWPESTKTGQSRFIEIRVQTYKCHRRQIIRKGFREMSGAEDGLLRVREPGAHLLDAGVPKISCRGSCSQSSVSLCFYICLRKAGESVKQI